MRTIEEVVEDFRRLTLHPALIDFLLNEILEIHKAEKRPKGKWITIEFGEENEEHEIKVDINGLVNDCVKCSICGSELAGSGEYSASGNFCPNCGADMRESEVKP